MCILLWTLPTCNHPRFTFAFASNRDEFMARETSRADFWDIDSILSKATHSTLKPAGSSSESIDPALGSQHTVGILSGQDLQSSQAANYTIQETEIDNSTGQEQALLTLSTEDVPGTWLGITTQGDLVALTNFRESMAYMAEKREPKLSRGKVCGEYLVTMAAAHNRCTTSSTSGGTVSKSESGSDQLEKARTTSKSNGKVADNQAEEWIRRRAVGWETEFEGLNLLVVQNSGEQQCIGGNREGSELTVFNESSLPSRKSGDDQANNVATSGATSASSGQAQHAFLGTVVGVSNSIFTKPWVKVEIGVQALERTLHMSLDLFGRESHASLQHPSSNTFSSASAISCTLTAHNFDDETKELAWLVIEMLTALRVNTKPYPKEEVDLMETVMGLRERVFVPRITMGKPDHEYGTRSSAVVLFGRENHIAVFAEKIWYGPLDRVTGERKEFAPDSPEGLVWWQGLVGQPRDQWRMIEGDELRNLVLCAKDVQMTKV